MKNKWTHVLKIGTILLSLISIATLSSCISLISPSNPNPRLGPLLGSDSGPSASQPIK